MLHINEYKLRWEKIQFICVILKMAESLLFSLSKFWLLFRYESVWVFCWCCCFSNEHTHTHNWNYGTPTQNVRAILMFIAGVENSLYIFWCAFSSNLAIVYRSLNKASGPHDSDKQNDYVPNNCLSHLIHSQIMFDIFKNSYYTFLTFSSETSHSIVHSHKHNRL